MSRNLTNKGKKSNFVESFTSYNSFPEDFECSVHCTAAANPEEDISIGWAAAVDGVGVGPDKQMHLERSTMQGGTMSRSGERGSVTAAGRAVGVMESRQSVDATDRLSNFRILRRRPGRAILFRFYIVIVV
ncbi:hypothetical protein QTP88_022237 [Uroleucon formosanum]